MKKVLGILLAVCACAAIVAVLAFSGVLPTSCSRVQLPGMNRDTAAVAQTMNSLTDTSDDNIREQLTEPLYQALKDADIDPREVFEAFYGHISYEIDEMQLPEEGPAELALTVSNIDMDTAIANYEEAFYNWQHSSAADTDDEKVIWRAEVDMLNDAFNDPNLETVSMELTAVLDKDESGVWRVTNESEIYQRVTGGRTPISLL